MPPPWPRHDRTVTLASSHRDLPVTRRDLTHVQLNFQPAITVTLEDWHHMTSKVCLDMDSVSEEAFISIMITELQRHVEERV